MTASELIRKLLKVDPDTRIFIRGSYGGFSDPEITEPTDYILDVNIYVDFGSHSMATPEDIKLGEKIVKGVCLR